MGSYGRAAIIATGLLRDGGEGLTPREAWEQAVATVFPSSFECRMKACPRGAFLGLCDLGVVPGVSPGRYTSSTKNKRYAQLALAALESDPSLVDNKAALWRLATEGVDLAPNEQMDVITALWTEGLIKHLERD